VAVLKPVTVLSVEPLHLNQSLDTDFRHLLLVGYPSHSLGKSISIADGKIRSRYRSNKFLHIDITAPIRKGNSGGPVLSSTLQVIGVAKDGETLDRGNNGVLRIDELIKLHEKKMSDLDLRSASTKGVPSTSI
jgi:V8-like Glu-specific endopeptidase